MDVWSGRVGDAVVDEGRSQAGGREFVAAVKGGLQVLSLVSSKRMITSVTSLGRDQPRAAWSLGPRGQIEAQVEHGTHGGTWSKRFVQGSDFRFRLRMSVQRSR
ncbi:predicted protein [Histoplasma capsulatum G186AR]|uniref:Uncharacterized protein n=1 Tax=Ajellomyces capsulatus (strain G186AR / H82 / ATCC MYA-2454 / RMSCC 2432) TaxID=447093 RepID=C0P0T2_AJECG|nr:uncharacterized protein HCBG_09012 [Histoplasma capsulatum G186AR]EEH02732.1 predicted protein [Histoplasma capsulatum G186AR]